MTPILEYCNWFSREFMVPILNEKRLSALNGADEFTAIVKNLTTGEEFCRPLARVVCEDSYQGRTRPGELLSAEAWMDTATGSIYDDDQCLSGPLVMLAPPVPTGRKVPMAPVRAKEGQIRSAMWEFGDDANG